MKRVSVSLILTYFIIVLFSKCKLVAGETGCPPDDEIVPCVCTDEDYYTKIVCSNITHADVLKQVFENSARYRFVEARIENTVVQYIPSEMFENTRVQVLSLIKVTMAQLFANPPEQLRSLQFLYIESSKFLSGFQWHHFEVFKEMKSLAINYVSIRKLTSDFSRYITKTLNNLVFNVAEIREIKPGALVDFTSINQLVFYKCRLTKLSRDIFPRPFNVMFMNFDENKISTIPDDLFTDMPNLKVVSMENNLLSIIPASAFSEGIVKDVDSFRFGDNPLRCDCLLVWIIKDKPKGLTGTCASPTSLKGRKLVDLAPSDFNC